MISHIDHLVLTVKNIEKTIAFYSTVLGMREITFGDNRKALQFGNQKINLHNAEQPIAPHAYRPTPGSADICFITDLSMTQIIDQLNTHKIKIIQGPIERMGAITQLISVYFQDPDKNLIELSTQQKDRRS